MWNLVGVQKRHLDIEQLGVALIAVSADKVESLAAMKEKKKLGFIVAHTPNGAAFEQLQVLKRKGLPTSKLALPDAVPVPGLMIFDRTFALRYTELRDSLLFRVGAKSLLRELPKLAFELVPKG